MTTLTFHLRQGGEGASRAMGGMGSVAAPLRPGRVRGGGVEEACPQHTQTTCLRPHAHPSLKAPVQTNSAQESSSVALDLTVSQGAATRRSSVRGQPRVCACLALTSHRGQPLEAPQTACKRAARRALLLSRRRAPVPLKQPSHEQQLPSNPSLARHPLLLLLHCHCHCSSRCFHLRRQPRCSLPLPPPPDVPSDQQALPKLPWR